MSAAARVWGRFSYEQPQDERVNESFDDSRLCATVQA